MVAPRVHLFANETSIAPRRFRSHLEFLGLFLKAVVRSVWRVVEDPNCLTPHRFSIYEFRRVEHGLDGPGIMNPPAPLEGFITCQFGAGHGIRPNWFVNEGA